LGHKDTRHESGWLASMSLNMTLRCSSTLGDAVLITIPGAMGVTQDATSAPEPSFSTRQMRQAPTGGQIRVMASRRNIYTGLLCQFQYGHSGITTYFPPIKRNGNCF
jgi:hypothetical protein